MRIFELLKQRGALSVNEIAAALGYKRRTNALREVVNGMLEAGVATYLYPEKPNSRKQKIRLVEK